MENRPREAKKKTKGRVSKPSRDGSSGANAQPQPPFGYTSQPPFFFQQPTHPSFYNTQQPNFGYFQNLLSMDAPPQSPAFDPYAFRSPQVPSTRENVERPLPIYDDEDEEVVPETQNLGDDDEEDEYNVDEDAGNEEDEAREKKRENGERKMDKRTRRGVGEGVGTLFYQQKKGQSTKSRKFLG
ncbi:hypothetical protein Hanom_Chr13g01234191 [Helianthus anomalus]